MAKLVSSTKHAPEVKTYGSEWNTVRVALNTTFDAVGKAKNKRIDFKVYEQRRNNKDRLKQSIYSTKEMTQRFIDENPHDDHFASFIRSWCDWQIQPLTKRSGKKIETIDDSWNTRMFSRTGVLWCHRFGKVGYGRRNSIDQQTESGCNGWTTSETRPNAY